MSSTGARMPEAGGRVAALALAALVAGPQSGLPGQRMRHETERAVVEYDAGTLSATEAADFARLADQGIADIESLVSPSLPARARRAGRVRFVVSARARMSRTSRETILLPLARVRSRSAPYLHESAHVLVPFRGSRVWLSEGLASYLESWVSENLGGYDAHVFTTAGDRGIHEAARSWLRRSEGRAVLPWVGARGEPPGMEWDRTRVARPFYVLSQSFTKHLVEAVGLDPVVRLALDGGRPSAFARLTGRSEEEWKRDWLKAINRSSTPIIHRPPHLSSPT